MYADFKVGNVIVRATATTVDVYGSDDLNLEYFDDEGVNIENPFDEDEMEDVKEQALDELYAKQLEVNV